MQKGQLSPSPHFFVWGKRIALPPPPFLDLLIDFDHINRESSEK